MNQIYTYWDNNQIKTKTLYNLKENQRIFSAFYQNGNLKLEKKYINNKLISDHRFYSKGEFKLSKLYNEGHLGSFIELFPCGKIKKKSISNKQGHDVNLFKIKSYFDNGHLKSVQQFKNNLANGKQIFFFKNGKVSKILYYKKGKKKGVMKKYYKNGNLKTEVMFMNNKKNGMQSNYSKNGIIERTIHYKNGKLNGPLINYSLNQILTSVIHYKSGLLNGDLLVHLSDRERIQLYFNNNMIDGEQYYYLNNTKTKTLYFFKNSFICKKENSANDNQMINELTECCVCYKMTSWKTPCLHSICIDCCDRYYCKTLQEENGYNCVYCRNKFEKITYLEPKSSLNQLTSFFLKLFEDKGEKIT